MGKINNNKSSTAATYGKVINSNFKDFQRQKPFLPALSGLLPMQLAAQKKVPV